MDRDTILQKLLQIHQNQAKDKKIGAINYDAVLSEIGFDSLDFSEIIVNVEDEFDCVIRMDDMLKIKTINDFADYIINEAEI